MNEEFQVGDLAKTPFGNVGTVREIRDDGTIVLEHRHANGSVTETFALPGQLTKIADCRLQIADCGEEEPERNESNKGQRKKRVREIAENPPVAPPHPPADLDSR